MGKLVEHLMPCAICGAMPKINDIYDIDPEKADTATSCFALKMGYTTALGNGLQTSTRLARTGTDGKKRSKKRKKHSVTS